MPEDVDLRLLALESSEQELRARVAALETTFTGLHEQLGGGSLSPAYERLLERVEALERGHTKLGKEELGMRHR